jgi:hypothetical protein
MPDGSRCNRVVLIAVQGLLKPGWLPIADLRRYLRCENCGERGHVGLTIVWADRKPVGQNPASACGNYAQNSDNLSCSGLFDSLAISVAAGARSIENDGCSNEITEQQERCHRH